MSAAESDISIRPAVRDDLHEIAVFIKPFVAEKKLLPRTLDELEDLLGSGFVAESGGRLVGFAALEVYSAKLAEIRSLAVAAEMQGRGIGRRLVQACLQLAREKTILEVMVITSEEPFFRSCGFDFTLPGQKKALFLQTGDGSPD